MSRHCRRAVRGMAAALAAVRRAAGLPVGPIVDYVLEGVPGCPQVRLRFLPIENAKVRPLVLTLYDSLAYDESLLDVVRDETARLTIHDTDSANTAGDIFWRIFDEADSHISSVNIQCGASITDAAIEYWDYSRLTDIEGVETEEFLFVESNKATGWFEIWRGVEVAAGKIATS